MGVQRLTGFCSSAKSDTSEAEVQKQLTSL